MQTCIQGERHVKMKVEISMFLLQDQETAKIASKQQEVSDRNGKELSLTVLGME